MIVRLYIVYCTTNLYMYRWMQVRTYTRPPKDVFVFVIIIQKKKEKKEKKKREKGEEKKEKI